MNHWLRRVAACTAGALLIGLITPTTAGAQDAASITLSSFTADASTVTVDGANGTSLEDLRTLFLPASEGGGTATIDSAALARIALARIDLEHSALARIALARIALARISVGDDALNDVLLSQIPFRPGAQWASWEAFLAGSRYQGAPLQTISLRQILKTDDTVVAARRATLDLGSLDLSGTALASLPIASILLAGAPLGDIPLVQADGTTVDGETAWCDELEPLLGERGLDCAALGLDEVDSATEGSLMSAALAGVPLEEAALARIALEDIPDSALDETTSPLAQIPLSQGNLQSSALARIALARIDLQWSALARIALARIDLESSALARIALARIDLQPSALARIALARIDLADSALARIALARINTADGSALDAVDLTALEITDTPLGTIPLTRANITGSQIGTIPLATTGITGTPLEDIDLTAIGSASALRDLLLTDLDLTALGLTVSDLPTLFPTCGGDTEPACDLDVSLAPLVGLDLGDLLDAAVADDVALTATLGDIIGTATPGGTLADLVGGLTPAQPLAGRTLGELGLDAGALTGSLADLLRSLTDPGDLGTLGGILELVPSLLDREDVTLGQLVLSLSDLTLPTDTLGSLIGLLDGGYELEGTLAQFLGAVSGDDLGTLGELLSSITGGEITGLGSLTELLRNLTDGTGLTLADLILFLLSPTEFDWEAISLDADDIAAIKLAGTRIRYRAVVDIDCDDDLSCPDGHLLQVTLPAGYTYAGSLDGAAAPEIDGQVLTFALPPVTEDDQLTIEFDVTPVVGAQAKATAQLLGPSAPPPPSTAPPTIAPVGSPIDALVDVNAGSDPLPGTANGPRELDPERLYLGALRSSDDVHYWSVDIGRPGERLSVFLGNLHVDYDLVVYGPDGAEAIPPLRQGAPEERALPLDTNPISLDPLSDAAGTEPREDLPLLEDRAPYAIAAERQGTGASTSEVVETGPLEVGTYLIQVSGYNGAFTDIPYTLRTAISDPPVLGACADRSWDPSQFDAAESTEDLDGVTALFLVNRQRLAATFGETRAQSVMDAVDDFIDDEPNGVKAGVLALDSVDAVNTEYGEWDGNRCEPQEANDVVRAIGDALDALDAPDLEHLVVVGADDIIPFSRVRDATTIANEQDYAQAFAANSELTSALARGYVLTDDPLADPNPVASADRQLYVPELGIGRLVEEPEDIVRSLGDFVDDEGEIDPGFLAADSAFTSGYDFLTDGATAVGDALANPNGVAPDERSLDEELRGDIPNVTTGGAWTALLLRNKVFRNPAVADLVSLNAHFDHSRLLPGLGNAEGTQTQLVGIGDVADNVAGSLLFSMGCHSGLSVSEAAGGAADEPDWAETFAAHGALWVGNTGFGYGDTDVVALSEQLMVNFAKNLDGAVPVGTALALAKQRYLADLGVISPYDEKALMQTTLYGLPMYELDDPHPAPTPPPSHPTLTAVAGAPGLQQAVVNQRGITFDSSADPENPNLPKYWSVGGRIQATQYRPIQPRMTVDVTPADSSRVVRGALVTDLVSTDKLTRPHVFRPVVHNAGQEQTPVIGDSAFPAAIQSVSTFETRQGERQQLVLIPGQFRTSSEGAIDFGTQRLYTSVDSLVYYGSASDGPLGPPATIEFADGARVGTSAAFVVETDRPASDILRAYVLYTAAGMGGQWEGLDLHDEGGRLTGNAPLPAGVLANAGLDYIVQVVTTDGQVSITSNKGRFFEAVTPEQSGLIPFTTLSTSRGGWYRDDPVRFSLDTAPARMTRLEYSVDGSAYVPYTRGTTFPVTGDGLHRLRARNVGEAASASTLVVPVDLKVPNVGPQDPKVSPGSTDGWNGPDVPTVTFFRDNDQGSISSGAEYISYRATGAQPTTDDQQADEPSISSPVSVEGVTTFEYWSTDRAGNDNDHRSFDVRFDKTKPTITAPTLSDSATPSTWVRVKPTSTITVTDPRPGGADDAWDESSKLRRVQYDLSGATTHHSGNLIPTGGPYPQSKVVTIDPASTGLDEGKTTVKITAEDVAGNIETRTYEIWYDATAATIGAPSLSGGATPSTWVRVKPTSTINVTDPRPGGADDPWDDSSKLRVVRFDLSGATTYASGNLIPAGGPYPQSKVVTIDPLTTGLNEGITTVTISTEDIAGNVRTSSYEIWYDATSATITAPTLSGGATPSTWVRVRPTSTITVTDPRPGGADDPWDQSSKLKDVHYDLSGATTHHSGNLIPANGPNPQSKTFTIDPTTVGTSGLREGKTTVTVTAEDIAHNIRISSYEIWYDATAPTITFNPPDFTSNLLATTTYGGTKKPGTVFKPMGDPANPYLKTYPVTPNPPTTESWAIPTYLLNQSVTVPYTCTDPLPPPPPTPQSSSGLTTCSGGTIGSIAPGTQTKTGQLNLSPTATLPSFKTDTVGVKTIQITTTDVAGNTYIEFFTYRVVYKIEMLYDHTKAGKSGATSPIKIKLRDAGGVDVSSSTISLKALEIQVGSSAAASPGSANPGGDFKFDEKSKTYQFNAKPDLAQKTTYGLAFQATPTTGTRDTIQGDATKRFYGPWTPYRAEFKIG